MLFYIFQRGNFSYLVDKKTLRQKMTEGFQNTGFKLQLEVQTNTDKRLSCRGIIAGCKGISRIEPA